MKTTRNTTAKTAVLEVLEKSKTALSHTEILFDIHLDLIYFGGIGMIIGHLVNYKLHKKQNH